MKLLVADQRQEATDHPRSILIAIGRDVANKSIARFALADRRHADEFDLGRRDGQRERQGIVNVAADVGVDEDRPGILGGDAWRES